MKKLCYAVLMTLLWTGVSLAQSTVDRKGKGPQAAVRNVLTSIEKTWNARDIDAFMANYWHSPDLTVFGSGEVTKGWDGELANNAQGFKNPSTLVLSDLQVELLGPNSAYARGKWQVTASDGKQHQGLFTIVFRKFGQDWKVVHDHASSGQ